jgi:hypothetical protein
MSRHIGFTLFFLLSLTACPLFAATNEEAVSAIKHRYRITTTSFLGGFSEIGSVLTPRREGIRANRPSNIFNPTVVRNHRITEPGGGGLPPGGIHDGAVKIGERLHLYGVRAGRDYVQLDLFTVATYIVPGSGRQGPTPLQASVRFQYDGGLTAVTTKQLLDDIGEWLAAAGESHKDAVESCPVTEQRPPADPAKPRGTGRATKTIRIGQTQEDVTAILGPPEKQILLGSKSIFVYADVKVVFVDGKVTDAE